METEQIDDLMVENIELQSRYLKRTVRIDLYHNDAESEFCNLLLVNDGQDLVTMDFKSMLKKLKLKQECPGERYWSLLWQKRQEFFCIDTRLRL